MGLRRLHRERLHGGRRAARLPAADPATAPCGHGVAEDGATRPRRRSTRAPTGDGVDEYRDSRPPAGAERPRVDEADRRRRAPDPAHQVPRRPVRPLRTTTSTTARRRSRRPTATPPAGPPHRSMVLLKNDDNDAAVRRGQEDRRDRAARPACRTTPRQGTGTTCSALVGRRARRGRGGAVRRHQGRSRRTRRTRAGCTMTDNELVRPGERVRDGRHGGGHAAAANSADQVVLALGETREKSGEAEVRSNIDAAGPPAGHHRRRQGDRQAVRGRAVQRPAAGPDGGRREARRRSSRRGSAASRPATRSRTSCSGRSTRAASCRSASRAASARCRSTTTTSRPGRPCDPTFRWNSRYRDILSVRPAVRVRLRPELQRRSRCRTWSLELAHDGREARAASR